MHPALVTLLDSNLELFRKSHALVLNLSSGAAALPTSQQRRQGVFLCGGADQDGAQVLDRDLPGMVIASLKRRPVKNNHLQGEVLGAAPSLAVTEMEVEKLQLLCYMLFSLLRWTTSV